jgi:hypothetical protein
LVVKRSVEAWKYEEESGKMRDKVLRGVWRLYRHLNDDGRNG